MDVSVDSRPTVFAVHYDQTIEDATRHFEAVGFQGVSSMVKQDPGCNCNDARSQVVAIAHRQDAKWFFEGEWDYSAGRCAIYEFVYDAFTGHMVDGPEDVYGRSAAWSGHV